MSKRKIKKLEAELLAEKKKSEQSSTTSEAIPQAVDASSSHPKRRSKRHFSCFSCGQTLDRGVK